MLLNCGENFRMHGDDSEKEAFLSYSKQSKLPNPTNWPDNSPVYVCSSRRAQSVKYDLKPQCFPLDGTPVHFDGPLFKGQIASRIKNAPPMNLSGRQPPSCTSKKYFKGERYRINQFAVTHLCICIMRVHRFFNFINRKIKNVSMDSPRCFQETHEIR